MNQTVKKYGAVWDTIHGKAVMGVFDLRSDAEAFAKEKGFLVVEMDCSFDLDLIYEPK